MKLKYNSYRYKKKSLEDNKKQVVSLEVAEYVRASKGKIRQVDLAKEIGVTQGQISNIQRGKYHLNLE